MPRLARETVAEREALALKMFKEGKVPDDVQAALAEAYKGVKMSPIRLMELFSEAKGLTPPKELGKVTDVKQETPLKRVEIISGGCTGSACIPVRDVLGNNQTKADTSDKNADWRTYLLSDDYEQTRKLRRHGMDFLTVENHKCYDPTCPKCNERPDP